MIFWLVSISVTYFTKAYRIRRAVLYAVSALDAFPVTDMSDIHPAVFNTSVTMYAFLIINLYAKECYRIKE